MFRNVKNFFLGTIAQAMSLAFSTSVWAQNQDGMNPTPQQLERMMSASGEEMETFALMLQMGFMVVFMIVLGAVLLMAKRDMRGWNQPIKWVWFSFQGRLNRKAYWLKGQVPMMLINFGVQIFLSLLSFVLVAGAGAGGAVLGGITALIVMLPFMIFSLWVGLAITAKRFHDLGSSAWWILGFFIPFYNLWLGIKLMFFRGTPGANDYGPDPIDEIDAFIEEMTGGGDVYEANDSDGDAVSQPKPREPEVPAEPQGFGARKFGFEPKEPEPGTPQEPAFEPEDLPGGDANLDIIKRRLGDDIMRPIKRKGGGGRPSES
ncbi:DUF805 domain-containing protein [Magnetovibrio sp. PR-2]|uniref:DUF805 domain-containing protein n=1 Tax=Magnetovibrio sp. PR-2 TaxID=3120356 RepID=UPI002FCE3037